ncbi:MAG: hypothetical protein GYA62_00695 [Bacteroidales bacterium]|nr:hypothetical protein [Bacteroidales bacterium]
MHSILIIFFLLLQSNENKLHNINYNSIFENKVYKFNINTSNEVITYRELFLKIKSQTDFKFIVYKNAVNCTTEICINGEYTLKDFMNKLKYSLDTNIKCKNRLLYYERENSMIIIGLVEYNEE